MPWSSVPWPWRRYELYYSELGVAFSIAAMALLIFLRPAKSREAAAMTAIAFVSAAIILPVHYTPSGLFLLGLPRFLLFLAPIVFAWTVPPLVQFLERKAIVVANAAVLAAAILFVVYAVQNAMRDVFVPFDYVVWTSDHRGSRIPPHARLRAATTVLDLAAGPQDSVAMDAGPTSLIYLLFGRSLQRPVAFIPPGSGPPAIPPQAKWVVIDRAGDAIFAAGGAVGRRPARAALHAARSAVRARLLRAIRAAGGLSAEVISAAVFGAAAAASACGRPR